MYHTYFSTNSYYALRLFCLSLPTLLNMPQTLSWKRIVFPCALRMECRGQRSTSQCTHWQQKQPFSRYPFATGKSNKTKSLEKKISWWVRSSTAKADEWNTKILLPGTGRVVTVVVHFMRAKSRAQNRKAVNGNTQTLSRTMQRTHERTRN